MRSLLVCFFCACLWPADDAAAAFTLPTTDKEWKALKGVVMVVQLNVSENAQPKLVLIGKQRVRVVPHPHDTWFCSWELADKTPVNWRGDVAQVKGFTKQLQIKCYESGGAQNGPVMYDNEKAKRFPWADVANLPDMIWTGPGAIVMRGQLSGEGIQGLGRGALRVKLMPLLEH